MDFESSTVMKTDQTRNSPGAGLLKNVPNHQGRYHSAVQPPAATNTSTHSASQTQNVSKQVTLNSAQGIVSSNAVISRLTSLPANTSSTFHVPRGAAAVANIAVPRAPLPNRGLQTMAGTTANHTIIRGNTSAVGVRTTLQVASTSPWISGLSTSTSSAPRPASSQMNSQPFSRAPSLTSVPRLASAMGNRTITESPSRPVLLHPAGHKQINLSQPPLQSLQINDKTFLKAGVGVNVGIRPQQQTTTVAVAATSSARTVAQPATINRISTQLPPVVTLHPTTVLVPTQPTLKGQQNHPTKILSQPPHIQIHSLPINSIAPQTLVSAVVTRPSPVNFSTTSTISGLTPTSRTTPVGQNHTSKVNTSESVFIQSSQKSSSSTTGVVPSTNIVSIGNPVYSLSSQPGNFTHYDHQTGYQIQRPNLTPNQTTASDTNTSRSNSGFVNSGQPPTGMRFNSVMVVEPNNRTSVSAFHSYISTNEAHINQSGEPLSCLTPTSQLSTPTKTNASPRPSILRKRESETTPSKAQKNLTPLLSTLNVITPSSPPSPKRPESRGNCGNQSSGGSTTISATSSPGLGVGEPDSPTHKQEPEPPPIEVSPRKKPRKQKLTGNQMQESKSDNEIEFITEAKLSLKKSSKENTEDGVQQPLPQKQVQKKAPVSLLSCYRHPWKSKHLHFLRYSDVRQKEDKKPTITEISNQKYILKRVKGWKIYHLKTQMEEVADFETEVHERLMNFLKILERKPGHEKDIDINRVNELIKGNMQRSKVIKDQMLEAKAQLLKIVDHQNHVSNLLTQCVSKRSVKKRDRV